MFDSSGYMDEVVLDRVRRGLLDRGLLVMYVECGNPMHRFGYTVGLTAHDHPELLLVGLPCEDAHWVLDDLGRQVIAGHRFTPGDVIDGLLACGYPLAVVGPVDPDGDMRYPVKVARAIFSDAGPPYQVVFPDAEYRFPWHDGYDMNVTQPLLGPVPS